MFYTNIATLWIPSCLCPVLQLVDEGSAPLTAVQLLWVNMIMDTLGALALPQNLQIMTWWRELLLEEGNFINNFMWMNIMGLSIYQFLVIWYLHAEGKWLFGIEGDNSDLVLNTIIFNCVVFCQVMWKWFLHSLFWFYQIYTPRWIYFVFLAGTMTLVC